MEWQYPGMIIAGRGSSSLSAALDLLWVVQQWHPQEAWQPQRRPQASQRRPWPRECGHLWSVLTTKVQPPVICPDHASAATCDQPAHTCLSILVRQTGAQGTEAQNEPGLPVERKNKSKNWFTTAATQPSLESYRQDAPTRVLNLGVPERCEPWALGWPQHCPDHCLRPTNQSMRKNRIWKSCMPSN